MSSRLLGLATSALLLGSALAGVGCEGSQGPAGANGKDGVNGTNGKDGADGVGGTSGPTGPTGPQGPAAPVIPGLGNVQRAQGVEQGTPLSSMVAIVYRGDAETGAETLADYVKARVDQVAAGTLPAGVSFPLPSAATDNVRTVQGVHSTVVTKWMDPLSYADGDADNNNYDPVKAPRFGANGDYIAFFGDDWNAGGNLSPVYSGSGTAGWVWVNHEYISNSRPKATAAPMGQHLTLARFLKSFGALNNDVTAAAWSQQDLADYGNHWKRQVGGSYFRVVQDARTGEWNVDLTANARRFDATSNTLVKVVGQTLSGVDHDDSGNPLPDGVVAGIQSDCSGGQTPWGTLITAEENVQGSYGDLETAWSSSNNLVFTTTGENPNTFLAGSTITPVVTPSTTGDFSPYPTTDSGSTNARHNRDMHGYLVEMDLTVGPQEYYGKTTAGVGHRKLGGMGRARWENATFAVGADFKLVPNKPIVIYSGDDRRSGRIYKFVSSGNYTAGMTREQIRQLLDTGKLYVAHFADLDNLNGMEILKGGASVAPTAEVPGQGKWIELSVNNETDKAPNAGKTVKMSDGTTDYTYPDYTVGQALKDVSYNGLGGFPNDDEVRRALFTASNKLGVMELNRPEDLEWNPKDPSGTPLLYIAFTEHGTTTALRQDGTLITAAPSVAGDGTWVTRTRDSASPEEKSGRSTEKSGGIFAVREADPSSPGASTAFTYFRVWKGKKKGDAGYDALYDASKPDNIAIDRQGGVWFGTDGNFDANGASDSIYYLDLNPAHVGKTYGKAFRVVATPSDAEATGPAFTPDMRTLFFNVQHPGEAVFSAWPYTK